MYEYLLKEQIDMLVKAKLIDEKKKDKAVKVLQKCWDNKIAITWSVEDVIEQAKKEGKRITQEKARGILQTILHRHDAGIGVNWDVISANL